MTGTGFYKHVDPLERKKDLLSGFAIGIYYGITIAFVVHSFDRSLDLRPYNRHLLANYGHALHKCQHALVG